ncbi:MAG: hypothetical protein ACHQ6T_16980, partial [Myxococcota bacterium]
SNLPDPNNPVDINVCQRTLGSGTREVFRNTWQANTASSATQGVGSLNGVTNPCGQKVGGLTGKNTLFHKQLIEGKGTNDVKTCVQQHPGSVGYVDGFINGPEFYGVPLEGVDPDTNDLKTLTRCGLYRFWGPLAGGTGGRLGGAASDPKTAHRAAMKTPAIFYANEAYLPVNGLNYTKVATDGVTTAQFVSPALSDPNGNALSASCPGTINPPGTIPP